METTQLDPVSHSFDSFNIAELLKLSSNFIIINSLT
jgi:hypothetical protein